MALQVATINEEITYGSQAPAIDNRSGGSGVVEQKIVDHLKRKLNSRIDKRLRHLYEVERRRYSTNDPDHSRLDAATEKTLPKHQRNDNHTNESRGQDDSDDNIFRRYDEFGERTGVSLLRRSVTSVSKLPSISTREQKRAHTTEGAGHKARNGERQTKSDMADYAYDEKTEAEVAVACCDDAGVDDLVTSSATAGDPYSSLSPVLTPHIGKRPPPMVRGARDSACLREGADAALAGDVTARCPPVALVARLYICAAGQDTRIEQRHFVQTLYPKLKEMCSASSCELQIIDMHWGMADACIDNHSYASSCIHALESSRSGQGSLVAIFTSGKYGECSPPLKLPPEEYAGVYKLLEKAHKAMLDEIEAVKQKLREEEEAEKASSSHKTLGEQLADDDEDDGESKAASKQPKMRHAAQAIINLLAIKEKDAAALKPSILDSWYKLDENQVPPVYRLQRVSTQLPDFVKADVARRRAARTSWHDASMRLRETLLAHSKVAAPRGAIQAAARTSLLEQEVTAALASSVACQPRTLWYSKQFDSMDTDDKAAEDFVEQRQELRARVRSLEEKIRASNLPTQCVNETMLEWTSDGFSPDRLRSHQLYLERLTSNIVFQVKTCLEPFFQEAAAFLPPDREKRALYGEVAQHITFCQNRAREFHGRKNLLSEVKKYLRSNIKAPLIIHGRSGNGRKSFVCRAAWESRKWCKTDGMSVIFRTCGLGGDSSNIRSLLYSICCQICIIYEHDMSSVPTDFKGLVNDFADRLKLATGDRKLLIVLDSPEALSDENDARKFGWLPREMPLHVKIILSTLSEEKLGALESMKKIWGDQKRSFIEVGDLPMEDAITIFDHWMKAAGRRLTSEQRAVVIDAVAQCPSPLYLKVAYGECSSWPSYATAEQTKLPIGVKRVVTVMLGRLERDHGDAVVRRALGYITAAKAGIARNELEDLLSLDEAVMDELSAHLQLPLRRCPPAIVERLVQELADVYLAERVAGGRRLMQWAHAQFREVAVERYLLQRDKAPSYHKALAEYFSGAWSDGKAKPVGSSEDTADRFVASQQLTFRSPFADLTNDDDNELGPAAAFGIVYNLRKLEELPYHLMGSQQFDALKSDCLCNYEWMLAKLCGFSFRALFDDYQVALAAEPRDKDLNLLLETLMLSRSALERDPRQLGSQLLGRLSTTVQRDALQAGGSQEPRQYLACHPLPGQIERSSVPTFVPSVTCLTPPGGALADFLQGHQGDLTAVALAGDGVRAVTASMDDTIKTWDLRSGKVLSTVTAVGRDVLELVLGCSDKVAITSELRCIRLWDLEVGRCIREMSDFEDYATLAVTRDGRTLAAYFVGRNVMKSWNIDAHFSLLCECQLAERSPADREKPTLVSKTSVGDLVLLSHQDAGQANTHNVKTGDVVHTLKCSEPSARIVALAISNDYFIIGNKFRLSKHEEPYALDLFNSQSGAFVRTLKGCCEDNLTAVEISSSGSHAICLSTSRQTWTTDLAVWNLETEEHKHLAPHAGLGTLLVVSDLRYVVSACRGERGARVWNISGAIIKPAIKTKQAAGVAALTPMRQHPKRVVVSTTDSSQLSVWNMTKGEWGSGMPVRFSHASVEPHDVVVVRNTRAIVLSDRGISPVSKESIFQSVYIYDLQKLSYERKVGGVYIIPSPPREYVLLGDDLLLGLSENRSHFVVWNISQGVQAYRIKPSFVTKAETTQQLNTAAAALARKRNMTAKMTPWDRRTESESARNGRRGIQMEQELRRIDERKKEKENGVEQFLMSGNEKIIVASYFAHHLCVFDVERRDHIHTLEDDSSVLHLYVSALTHDGNFLVLSNYNDEKKTSYVTLWDCFRGEVRKRLKNERDVRALGISNDGRRVVIGKSHGELRTWVPAEKASVRKLAPYPGFRFLPNGNKIFVLRDGTIALVYAGDISAWDLRAGLCLAVYTPDTRISSLVTALDGKLICFGLCDSTNAVALRLMSRPQSSDENSVYNMLGDVPYDSDSD